MTIIGPQLPPGHARERSTSISSRSSVASSTSRSPSPFGSEASDRQPARRTVAGPQLPDNLVRSRSNSASSSRSKALSSDDDQIGPSVGPALASTAASSGNGLSDGAKLFLEREARKRVAEEEARLSEEKAANSRPEWMLLPPSLSNASSLQVVAGDPLNLKSRGFAQTTPRVSARGGASAEDADTSVWTETPEERLKRMQDEVSGVKAKSGAGTSDRERLERERAQRRDSSIAAAVADGRSGKKSLVEEHNDRRRRELKDKLEDEAREERRREKRRRRDDSDRSEKRTSRHGHNDDRDRRRRHRSRSRSRSRSPDARDKAKDRDRYGSSSSSSHRHRSSRRDESHRSHAGSRHRHADADASDDDEEERRRERRKRKESQRSRDKDAHRHEDRDREKDRKSTKSRKEREEEDVRSGKQAAPMIWDRDAALSIGGRLMDEAKRGKMMADANALGDRFGSGSRRFL